MFVSLAFLVPKCNAVFFKLCMLSCNPPSRIKHISKHNFSTMHILRLKQNYILKSQQHGFLFKGTSNKTELIQDSRTKNLRTTRGFPKVSEIGMQGQGFCRTNITSTKSNLFSLVLLTRSSSEVAISLFVKVFI